MHKGCNSQATQIVRSAQAQGMQFPGYLNTGAYRLNGSTDTRRRRRLGSSGGAEGLEREIESKQRRGSSIRCLEDITSRICGVLGLGPSAFQGGPSPVQMGRDRVQNGSGTIPGGSRQAVSCQSELSGCMTGSKTVLGLGLGRVWVLS
ncbi:hypothetical protein C8R47DRAFT_1203492 [Mycena vitilis]|nr:hypothetical protein C8R47DRAFT_1203492 [Mycena vitilis]